MREIRVFVKGFAFGLPGVTPEDIQVQALLRFAGCEHKATCGLHESASPSAQLPMIEIRRETGEREAIGHPYVFDALQSSLPELGAVFSEGSADDLALVALVESRMARALWFAWWCEKQNYNQVIWPVFCRFSPFPASCWQPWVLQLRHTFLLGLLGVDRSEQAYGDAEKAAACLSARLGDKPYFHGSKPSPLDALVFGHLIVYLCVPLPVDHLAAKVRKFSNLVQYCRRILDDHFPEYVSAELRGMLDTTAPTPEPSDVRDALTPREIFHQTRRKIADLEVAWNKYPGQSREEVEAVRQGRDWNYKLKSRAVVGVAILGVLALIVFGEREKD